MAQPVCCVEQEDTFRREIKLGKQDVIDAVRGQPTSRAPWVPYVGIHAARLIGEPADRYLQDSHLIAKGVLHAAMRYKADGIPLLYDLSIEAMSMDCGYKWQTHCPPTITEHPLENECLSESDVRIPGPADGRWPGVIAAGKKIRERLGDVALYGVVTGPLVLALLLRGISIYKDLYRNKAVAKEIIDFCGQVAAESARTYAEDIGCDVIAIADPLASQLRPHAFREFVKPAVQPVIQAVRTAGKVSTFFVCGNATTILEEVAQVGTDGFSVDEQVNLTYARDVALQFGVGFAGNLSVCTAVVPGNVSPREDAIRTLSAGATTGYILATATDMPYDVPEEYVDEVLKAKDWFYRNYRQYPRRKEEEGGKECSLLKPSRRCAGSAGSRSAVSRVNIPRW
ncbi:MAG: uroporphyrinogen decarboxylase family protein [Desulfomonilaceae bacterium]|nr:uroporphyrinogen decarboxylase family protein [Desulfomonilaceae bacterium]